MPNHVTNRLSISGEIAEKKHAYASLIGNYGRLDFNTMVPMPRSLNIPSSGFVESLALALKGKVDVFKAFLFIGTGLVLWAILTFFFHNWFFGGN